MPKLNGCLLFLLLFLMGATGVSAQDRPYQGKVSGTDGKALSGVSVVVSGSNTGTYTDAQGLFSLNGQNAADSLVFSMVGYRTVTLPATPGSLLQVTLFTAEGSMDEVVVVGYGTQKRANLTGAVAQVSGKVLEDRPLINIGQGLQGAVANLNITVTGDPGGPGTPASFNIRGQNSLSGGEPFYLVDGIPASSINNINPADIESITVLKDAASAAIYGARAAFGVILVTTKKGKKGERMLVNYNNMASFSHPTRLPQMANSLEFAETYNAAAANSGISDPFGPDAINRIKQYMADPNSIPVTIPNPANPNQWSFTDANANVDWFEEYIKPWSFNHKHDLSVSGGGGATTYFMSLGYLGQEGQLRHGNEYFERINVTTNVHTEPLSWARIDLRMRYAKSTTDIPFPYSDLMGNWFHLIGTRQPIWPVKNPDGHYSQISIIPFFNDGGRTITDNNDLWLTGALELEPVKNWKINMDYTWNIMSGKSSAHDAFVKAYAIDGSRYDIGHAQNAISKSNLLNEYTSFNLYTSYERNFSKHYLKVLIGQQAELSRFNTLTGSRLNLITDAIPSMGVATGTQQASEALSHWATAGTFGRLTYSFDEKYLFEVNARRDGTSKFPEENRFGVFPSVSAGYNIAKEKFWPLQDLISEFKIRGSYGSLGNQSVANYLYLARIPIFSNLGYIFTNQRPNYLGTPGLVSSGLTWEVARTLDFGLDAALLQNRLNVSFDWYVRKTLDMFGPAEALPSTLGTAVPQMNNADLETRGIELTIGWRDRLSQDFSYNLSLVLSDNKARITRYNNPTKLLSTFYEGQTVGEIWGMQSHGLIQTQKQLEEMPDQSILWGSWGLGDVLYEDLDGDGKLSVGSNTLDNHGDLTVIGNNSPRYSFGFTAGFNWKGFDFNMFWQGIAKRDIWLNGTIFYGLLGGYGSAVWKNTLDYWTPENTGAYWPKPYYTSEINKNRYPSSLYLQNAAYLRMKNIQLGYTLSPRVLSAVKMRQLRVFVTGENLITVSSVNKNFDPEVVTGAWGSGKMYPLMKTFTVGLNIGL